MADLEKLDNVIKELEEESNALKEFSEIYSEIGKLKQEIFDNLRLLRENNEGLSIISEEIQSRFVESEKQLMNLGSELSKRMEEFYQDSKRFQKELDSSIMSRLDKHKSDIQVEIRNVGTQIQGAFEIILKAHFNSMESKLEDRFARQTKQINTLKILLVTVIGISIALAIQVFLK